MPVLHAVLFSGGVNTLVNYSRYRNDLERYCAIVQRLPGGSAARLRILYGDGSHTFGGSIPSSVASRATLRAAIDDIGRISAIDDRFLFVASNHGGPTVSGTTQVRLWCYNQESVEDQEFASWCSVIPAKTQIYILGQCNSGGFIDDLTRPDRLVITACRYDEYSYATADLLYDEFLLRVAEAIESHATSYADVFSYVLRNDTQPEHPQLSDPGNIRLQTGLL